MYQQGRNYNEERRARLACFVLDLFPNIMRCYLSYYIYKKALSNKYCSNKRNPPVFTSTELLSIKELPKVENFTIQLCYKYISFEGLLPTPSCGWGKLPHYQALTVADDIERIRHNINAIKELNNDVCTEVYLVKFLYKLEQIIHRLQIATGNKSVDTDYKSLLIKQIDTAVVLAELENVGVIDSDVQQIKLKDRERYSKISAVITEFFPKLLRIMIPSTVTPLTLYNFCTMPGYKWDKSQQSQIQKLQYGQNYESLDASLLCKIFRRFNFVPAPTQGWGRDPTNTDLKIADDIERIRLLRNKTAHQCDTCIDQTDFDNYFLQFCEITHRIAIDHEHELAEIQECHLESERQDVLEKALQQLEDIKERFKKSPFRYYWGNDFELKIKDVRQKIQTGKDLLGQDSILIEIELPDINDTETRVNILNNFKEEIQEGDVKIEFIRAFTGSLVLHAYISTETLTTDKNLHTELASFMTRILKKGMFEITTTQWIDAVICPSEGNKDLELNSFIPKSLRLQFNVKMDVFETNVSLESEIGACMQRTLENLNGKGFKEEVTARVHYAEFDDRKEAHAMETSQLIPVETNIKIEKEDTVVTATMDKDDTKEANAMGTSQLIPVDTDIKIEKEGTVVTATMDKDETEDALDMEISERIPVDKIDEIKKEGTVVSGKEKFLPSQKHLSFTHTSIIHKPIDALPGIGTTTKSIFEAKGFTKATDLLCIFFRDDEESFKKFLSTFGMNKGQQNNTYDALKDWVNQHC